MQFEQFHILADDFYDRAAWALIHLDDRSEHHDMANNDNLAVYVNQFLVYNTPYVDLNPNDVRVDVNGRTYHLAGHHQPHDIDADHVHLSDDVDPANVVVHIDGRRYNLAAVNNDDGDLRALGATAADVATTLRDAARAAGKLSAAMWAAAGDGG